MLSVVLIVVVCIAMVVCLLALQRAKRRIRQSYEDLSVKVSEAVNRNCADNEIFLMVAAERIDYLVNEARESADLNEADSRRLTELTAAAHALMVAYRDNQVPAAQWCEECHGVLAGSATQAVEILEPYYLDTNSPDLNAPLGTLRALPATIRGHQKLARRIQRDTAAVIEEGLGRLRPPN